MRAIRVAAHGGPDVLRHEEVDEPRPGEGQVLVAVEAVGVNFIETYHRTGAYPSQPPYTPGTEAAGTVVAVGPGVTDVKPGDRVGSTNVLGAYAERALAPANRLVALPDGVTARLAAAVLLQGMTAHYLATSVYPLKPGDTCLVHAAAGGVGLLLCQIAKARGARVLGTVSSEAKAALARETGVDETLGYEGFAAEARRLTGGVGVQVVYDSVGRTTFEKGFDALAPRGMMALFGQSSGAVSLLDPQLLNRKGSLFLTRPTLHHYTATREELQSRADDVLGWVKGGVLKVRVHRELPLAEAAEAHRLLEGRQTTGKVLLIP